MLLCRREGGFVKRVFTCGFYKKAPGILLKTDRYLEEDAETGIKTARPAGGAPHLKK